VLPLPALGAPPIEGRPAWLDRPPVVGAVPPLVDALPPVVVELPASPPDDERTTPPQA
jgi:hypothetical protein